jgi:OOP family OmpA-OmpF porin
MNAPQLIRVGTAVLALAAFGCKTLPEKQPIATQPIEIGGDEWRVTDNVIVITDGSGTQYMNETFPDAKALTRSFVSAMPAAEARSASRSGYDAGLVGFGGDDRQTAPLAAFDRGRLASTASELEVMGDINGLGGETPLHAVIAESQAALASKSGRAALVIFTDGLPDDPGLALGAARQLVKARQGNVCIHTVQTGTDPEGATFLKQLSALTSCGSYRAGSQIASSHEVQQLSRAVFLGSGDLPAVAAGPCEAVVRLRGIEFAFDRDEITESSKPVLDAAAQRLRECPDIKVTVGGHTDAIGTDAYNQDLSYRRANSARSYLIESGIASDRLQAEGFGESEPVAPNDSDAGRAQNRRVELAPLR